MNMCAFRQQRIRDPLHDLIEFGDNSFENTLWNVIQTRPFQRLRRVKQLGFSELVYPGATHTRFAHSLGVFHTARELMKHIKPELEHQKRYEPSRAQIALAAALVHDVGHGPFSHSFEKAAERLGLDNLKHEVISARIIKDSELTEEFSRPINGFADEVANLIAADGPTDIYSSVVSSQFDADRLDYMRRDKLMTGTQHSEIDYTWLLANLKIGTVPDYVDEEKVGEIETLVLDGKARFAAETYVLGLFQLYPTIYFHKATRSAERIFTELLVRLYHLVENESIKDTGLPRNHPLVRFFKKPHDLDRFLDMDDFVVWGALSQISDCKDKELSSLAERLRNRNLWKSKDLRADISRELGISDNRPAIDRATIRAKEKIIEWVHDHDSIVPRIVIDSANRTPYKKTAEAGTVLNEIFVQYDDGLHVLTETSEIVKAASVFKLDRAYFAAEDDEAKKAIADCIHSAIQEEKGNVA